MGGVDVTPNFFSFNVSGGASSLDLAVLGAGDIGSACIGAVAAFGGTSTGVLCGPGGINGFAIILTQVQNIGEQVAYVTQGLPNVTLVSSVNTPIPSALPLLASGLAALGLLFGWQGKQKVQAVAA